MIDYWKIYEFYFAEYGCYRARNSTGQKSGIYIIQDDEESIKVVVDIHFFDDSSIVGENTILIHDTNNYLDDMIHQAISYIVQEMINHIDEKEKKYNKYLEYKKLDETLTNKLNETKGVKV